MDSFRELMSFDIMLINMPESLTGAHFTGNAIFARLSGCTRLSASQAVTLLAIIDLPHRPLDRLV